ncbi:MAG: hypothetical protein ACI83W_000788 [Marinoscillum sp.]|jgi:hypothetical protein
MSRLLNGAKDKLICELTDCSKNMMNGKEQGESGYKPRRAVNLEKN